MADKKEISIKKEEEITQDMIDLVVARLDAMPRNVSLSVGDQDSRRVDELIEDVKESNDVGRTIVKIQMDYLRSLQNLSLDE